MKVIPGQIELSVPSSPGARAELSEEEREQFYAEQMGATAAARQRQAYADAHRCTCARQDDRAPVERHHPGCHKIPLRLNRR